MKKRTFISRHAKVFLSLMICLLFMLALVPAPASAADPITIKVNGVTLETDTPPFIKNSTTMVPLRSIFEALGAKVEWNGEKKEIVGTNLNLFIMMWIDNELATVTNLQPPGGIKNHFLNVPPIIVNGRTFVPARFVSEALGAEVS
jgi:hypothetical protein